MTVPLLPRERRLEIGVPTLPVTFEIGLATVQYETKQVLYESQVGYRVDQTTGGIPRAAIGQPDRFVGRLAERWTVSDDARTVTMTLRDGVRSVAGNVLSALDVKYTFDRGFNVPGYYRWTAQVGGLASNDDVKVVDRRTVVFHLSQPCAYFLDTRCLPMNGIFDAAHMQSKATEDDPWSRRYVEKGDAGFGPFRLEDKCDGELQRFRARTDYYRGKPGFDQVLYRVIPDTGERLEKLKRGEIDYAHGLSSAQVQELRGQPGLQTAFGSGTQVIQLSLQHVNSPFADVHLRRALANSLPYDHILDRVFQGAAAPWRGCIPPVVPGYDESIWPYRTDPVRANEERKQVSVSLARPVRIVGSAGIALHEPLSKIVAETLAGLGVQAAMELETPETFAHRRDEGDYDVLLSGAGPQVADPGYCLSHDFCSDSEGNDFRYSNPAFDTLVNQGLNTVDPIDRLALYRNAQQVLARDVPIIPIASVGFSLAISSRVSGIHWYPNSSLYPGELYPA